MLSQAFWPMAAQLSCESCAAIGQKACDSVRSLYHQQAFWSMAVQLSKESCTSIGRKGLRQCHFAVVIQAPAPHLPATVPVCACVCVAVWRGQLLAYSEAGRGRSGTRSRPPRYLRQGAVSSAASGARAHAGCYAGHAESYKHMDSKPSASPQTTTGGGTPQNGTATTRHRRDNGARLQGQGLKKIYQLILNS